MKKKLIALALIIIVALAAMEGLYLLLRRAHEARQTAAPETTVERAPVAETPMIQDGRLDAKPASIRMSAEIVNQKPQEPNIREPSDEPPKFEDMPKESQQKYLARRKEALDRMYASKLHMRVEEWQALTAKEQRILIKKGTRK